MDDQNYKSRTQGAVGTERMQLLCIIAHYWEELDRYEFEGGSQRQKWDLWETIANEFNNLSSVTVTRTPIQVKTLFKNMKTKAKKYRKRIEESKESGMGVVIENDPISETVLQLNRYQSKENLRTILEPLKTLYLLSRNSELPLLALSEKQDNGKYVLTYGINNSNSENSSNENAANLAEESMDDSSDKSSSVTASSPIRDIARTPSMPNISSHSNVHTFGDISVTPILNSKAETMSSLLRSPQLSKNTVTDSSPRNPLKRPASSMFEESSDYSTPRNFNPSSNISLPVINGYTNTKSSLLTKFCCTNFISQILTLLKKEHLLKSSLLKENILSQKSERALHEVERKFQELEFQCQQEKMEASIEEHQKRLKILELEQKILQYDVKDNEFRKCVFNSQKSKEI